MLSKPLKDFAEERFNNEFWWKIKSPYYKLMGFIERSIRLYKWAKFMWTNWDFDGNSIYPLLEYKLLRLQECLDRGYAIQEDRDMKALRIMIKLANRLSNDYHDNKYRDWHDKKWGEAKYWNEPCLDQPGYYTFCSSRPNANTEEEKKQEREEFISQLRKVKPWMQRDEKWLFDILRKHIHNLWD